MAVSQAPILAPPIGALPSTLKDLTIGQVVTLLRVRGGEAATLIVAALIDDTPRFAIASPQDQCTLAMLGLVYATGNGMRLTGKGTAWSDQIVRGA
jgi:hypothetical protein